MTEFLIGCDPEIFLRKKGEAVSAHGVIKGTKAEPFPVEKGAYQVDGMAVEFNTEPVTLVGPGLPYGNHNAFEDNVTAVMNQLKAAVKEHDDNLVFNIEPVQEFSEDVFKNSPKEAVELGCIPDFNAYTLEENPRPDGDAVNFRTGSGHIHIGWTADVPVEHPDHREICAGFIKYMDATVGLYMTIIDGEQRRRELYGKAGAFRPKPYGVEYRTPSNAWLTNKNRRQAIYELTKAAVSMATNQYDIRRITGVSSETIQLIINSGDFHAAYVALETLSRDVYFGHWRMRDHIKSEYDKRKKPTQVEKSKEAFKKKKEKERAFALSSGSSTWSNTTTTSNW